MEDCCEACDGSGEINGETCKYCKGVGWFEDPEELPDSDPYSDPYLMADEFLGPNQHPYDDE